MTPAALLATLQNADSFFPGGGSAFSWGLESLIAEGWVRNAEELARFIEGQLACRWATCDRPVMAAAFGAAQDCGALARLDRELEAMTLAEELRAGSRRAGGSLLAVHERIRTPGAARYRAALAQGSGLGHLSVVQGLVWAGAGLSLAGAEAASAHMLCAGLLGAALRLGAVGHVAAQEILLRQRPLLAVLLAQPAPQIGDICACVPATEIAAMHHESQSARLFAN
jgi:urease accessory protein